MSNQKFQRRYWSGNLDPRNLGGGSSRKPFDFKEEIAFYFSPEQEYALKLLWGEEGLKGKRILEIGSGMGAFALFLARQEVEVFVIDLSTERLKFLKTEASRLGLLDRIRIVCGVAESLPFASDSFDAVYTKSVLIHTNLERAGSESVRVLKKGGKGVFVEPLRYNPFAILYRRFLGPKEWRTITTYFDKSRIRQLASPFGRVKVRFFYLFGFMAFIFQFAIRNLRMFRIFVSILHGLDKALFSLCPPLKRLAWFAVIHGKKPGSCGK